MKGTLPANTPCQVNINDEKISDVNELCNLFNEFFMSLPGLKPVKDRLKLPPYSNITFYLYPTTPDEIEKAIIKTTLKSAAGIDEICGKSLKVVSNIINTPLSYIINESFCEGKYPSALKISKSVPIFKNTGSREEISNYRNVCLQSQLAKVLEISFNTRLNTFLEKYNLFSDSQNGFRSMKSTSTAIADLCTSVYDCLNNKQFSIALYFDLTRAFDTIDHDLLLEKMYRIGIRGTANDWAASYLGDRTQIVVIDKFKSNQKEITTGVPQGSILGPLFFIIFMNDLTYACTSSYKTIVYADDTNQLIAENNLVNSVLRANISADEFYQWCLYTGVMVNTSKTFLMYFQPKNINYNSSQLIRINHRSIEQVNSIKFLGITVDQKLTWEKHIDNIVAKLSKICFIIRQLRVTVSMDILKLTYYGLVQSILSYGLIFWGHSAHINKVLIMQKKIVKCMVRVHMQTPCKPIFTSLSILTVTSLYIYLIVLNIKKEENLFIKNKLVHDHDTRNSNNLYQPFSRLSVGQNSHIYQGIICFNKFVSLFDEINNFNDFKHNLYIYLASKAFYSVDEFLNS